MMCLDVGIQPWNRVLAFKMLQFGCLGGLWVVSVLPPGNVGEYQGESPRTQASPRVRSRKPSCSAEFAPSRKTYQFSIPQSRKEMSEELPEE